MSILKQAAATALCGTYRYFTSHLFILDSVVLKIHNLNPAEKRFSFTLLITILDNELTSDFQKSWSHSTLYYFKVKHMVHLLS